MVALLHLSVSIVYHIIECVEQQPVFQSVVLCESASAAATLSPEEFLCWFFRQVSTRRQWAGESEVCSCSSCCYCWKAWLKATYCTHSPANPWATTVYLSVNANVKLAKSIVNMTYWIQTKYESKVKCFFSDFKHEILQILVPERIHSIHGWPVFGYFMCPIIILKVYNI